ncbi:MAG: prephenate dehydrogenase [Firmicutes bacterium]|nr:prephenate dehydrogenase [Bacillota bacterium]
MTKETNILMVGLGIIGGSYARGLTKAGYTVKAIDTDPATIQYALENNIIAEGTTEADRRLIGEADLLIFALYPHIFKEWIAQNQWFLKSGAIITDVTGVKGRLVGEIQEMLRDDCEYIAAHPMAGGEKLGIWHSDEKKFYDANYIVVPTEKNTENAVETCRQLGEILQFARISQLPPYEHDEMIGFVSQLTHCIAMTLMTCNDTENLEDFTGDSFRDLTRIARIDDVMWSELFLSNKDALLHQMKLFTMEFSKLERMLMEADKDGIRDMMRRSTARRALFEKEKPEDKPEETQEA